MLRAVDSRNWALFPHFPDLGFVAQLGVEIGGLSENNLIDMGMNLSLDAYEGGSGSEREGDNLNGDKAKEMQRIAEHLLKERYGFLCSARSTRFLQAITFSSSEFTSAQPKLKTAQLQERSMMLVKFKLVTDTNTPRHVIVLKAPTDVPAALTNIFDDQIAFDLGYEI
ncbi:hypothetical protein C8J57DRAFT_1477946 [Mycena rebaudengoi]|nr:hypothetical protein C8J57DRAFT_1477946 [Mycena rebaudengoi]